MSRRVGIGYAVAGRLADLGASIFATGWPPHDEEMPWGSNQIEPDRFAIEERDLEDARVPAALVDEVIERCGAIDIVLAVHARSSHQSLLEVTGDELDRCWAVNVRSAVLLARRLAERRDRTRPGGRLIWFTSGQDFGPMASVLPYAVTKGALHQMTASLAEPLADLGIIVNCVNPGPVDTGYAVGEVHEQVAGMFPSGRWGRPADVANLIEFLVRDEGEWVQGQVINSEGGFRRWA